MADFRCFNGAEFYPFKYRGYGYYNFLSINIRMIFIRQLCDLHTEIRKGKHDRCIFVDFLIFIALFYHCSIKNAKYSLLYLL